MLIDILARKEILMEQLQALYNRAVEQTKVKVKEDIDRYIKEKPECPSYEHYLRERTPFITQIWLNIWLNLTTSHLSKNEKKMYLADIGLEAEDIPKKQLNQIFRSQIRNVEAFDVLKWLEGKYADKKGEWRSRYEEARANFIKQEEERKRLENQSEMRKRLKASVQKLIEDNEMKLYVLVRYTVARQLVRDINKKGYVQSSDYSTFETFLIELSDPPYQDFQWKPKQYEIDMYEQMYERVVLNTLLNNGPRVLLDHATADLQGIFKQTFDEKLTETLLKDVAGEFLFELSLDFFEEILDEFLSDLTRLADIPFDVSVHENLFQQDLDARKQKREEELAEIKRKQEEEERMLEDIFGREYRPAIGKRIRYVLHIGETNTGKTFHALEKMKAAESGLYLAPLRLLALEVFDKLNSENVPCSLKTGEEEKNTQGANHISCTVEMFHEKDYYDVVVIDEAQMIADKDRGFSWYKAITKANAHEVHIIGSLNMKEMVVGLLGDANVEIKQYERDVPLEVERNTFSLKHVKKGDALVCFSRRRVLETASILQRGKHSVSMIYGSMPPETRKKQMQRFINGETTVIVSTDAIGMGLNLPIRRIVILENEKFDGTRRRRLTSQEVKQIAGRAGRKGIYDVGKVAFTSDIKMMARLLTQKDEPLQSFAIAPTTGVFERFQKYSRNLGRFFELWEKFEGPPGTKKATLEEERILYESIRGTIIEARFSLMDLYGFLHLPFSTNEPRLRDEWKDKMVSIVGGNPLPEPTILNRTLEDLELSYKSIGLHLLFLYRLDKRTEATYWERVRDEVSDEIHEILKNPVKASQKKCKTCGRDLPNNFVFQTCNSCHKERFRKKNRDS